jgi:hypothetical protein
MKMAAVRPLKTLGHDDSHSRQGNSPADLNPERGLCLRTPCIATAQGARSSLSRLHDHAQTPHLVGLLRTSDQPDAQTST